MCLSVMILGILVFLIWGFFIDGQLNINIFNFSVNIRLQSLIEIFHLIKKIQNSTNYHWLLFCFC
jgi:hypothetical protein